MICGPCWSRLDQAYNLMEEMVQIDMNFWQNQQPKEVFNIDLESEFIDISQLHQFIDQPSQAIIDIDYEQISENSSINKDQELEELASPELQNKNSLECLICNKVFKTQGYLLRHLNVIHQKTLPKRIRCHLCTASFYNDRTLNNHILTHFKMTETEKTREVFNCDFVKCHRIFKSLAGLRSHEKKHTTNRPFRCWCKAQFKAKGHLRNHKLKNMH